MDKTSPFTPAEIEAEHQRRRSPTISDYSVTTLECVHCHSHFNPAKGGNAEVPMCDLCLHGG